MTLWKPFGPSSFARAAGGGPLKAALQLVGMPVNVGPSYFAASSLPLPSIITVTVTRYPLPINRYWLQAAQTLPIGGAFTSFPRDFREASCHLQFLAPEF